MRILALKLGIYSNSNTDWHERGGVVSRGVLIDYKSYAEANGIQYRPYDSHIITISEIETIARNQGVEFRQGDVFLLRTGYTEALTGASAEEQDEIIRTNKAVGVEGTMKAVKWFWDIHCSAVACDTVGFEVCPAVPPEGSDDSGSTGLGEFLPLSLSSFTYRCISVTSTLSKSSRYTNWRALGPQDAVGVLCKEKTVHFHANFCSAKYCWRCWVSSKCVGDFLA